MQARLRLAVAAGGALGSVARVWLDTVGGGPAALPWPTLAVNVTGAFALAALAGRLRDPVVRAALLTGAVGAWTTVSTFAVEVVDLGLLRDPLGAAYLVLTLATGVVAAWLGERSGPRPHAAGPGVGP